MTLDTCRLVLSQLELNWGISSVSGWTAPFVLAFDTPAGAEVTSVQPGVNTFVMDDGNSISRSLINVTIDPDDAIAESNEPNNLAVIQVTLIGNDTAAECEQLT